MSSAMLNIRVLQPRMLTLKQAADYVGVPVKKFAMCCPVAPIALTGGVVLYDIRDIDQWVDQVKAGSVDSDADILGKL